MAASGSSRSVTAPPRGYATCGVASAASAPTMVLGSGGGWVATLSEQGVVLLGGLVPLDLRQKFRR